jgi:plastocyanin
MVAGRRNAVWWVLVACLLLCRPITGEAADAIVLTLKDHKFTPDTVTVAAGQRLRIEVINSDATVEEFESYDLKLEKIVVGGGKITLNAGPLKPGRYKFFGDYHPDQAVGTLIAVAP